MEYSLTEKSIDACYNMYDCQRHAKWKNPDTKDCVLYGYIYMKFLKKADQ